jgi:hypothetical protein
MEREAAHDDQELVVGLWIVTTWHRRRAVSRLLDERIGTRLPCIDRRHAAGTGRDDFEDHQFLKLAVVAASTSRKPPNPQDGGMRLPVLKSPFELFAEDTARAPP